jgi:hypothetical protein
MLLGSFAGESDAPAGVRDDGGLPADQSANLHDRAVRASEHEAAGIAAGLAAHNATAIPRVRAEELALAEQLFAESDIDQAGNRRLVEELSVTEPATITTSPKFIPVFEVDGTLLRFQRGEPGDFDTLGIPRGFVLVDETGQDMLGGNWPVTTLANLGRAIAGAEAYRQSLGAHTNAQAKASVRAQWAAADEASRRRRTRELNRARLEGQTFHCDECDSYEVPEPDATCPRCGHRLL